MKLPNWLYCFSEEDQCLDDEVEIGLLRLSVKRIDRAIKLNLDLEPEDIAQFNFEETLHYALKELGMLGKYSDLYFNVTKKDLTYAALRKSYDLMLLIDSKKKENTIKKIAIELFEQRYSLEYPVDEGIYNDLSVKYAKRKKALEEEIMKFNVLR